MSKEAEQSTSYITLVQAPGIPASERTALEAHWREAILDSEHTVVTNYVCRIDQIALYPGTKLLVQAPDVPTSEVKRLRNRIDKARKAKKQVDRVVVINYNCRIDAVTA